MDINEVKHVAMYLRISDDKKESSGKRMENEDTLRNHKEILTNYAARHSYTYEIFQEVVTGGHSEIANRPELHSLLNRIEEFDAILVVELSRISRNGKISELVLEYCQDYHKLIITPETSYDLNNDMDALMFRLGSAISEHERSIIGKRIKNNKIQMTKMGLNASGSSPLGYKRNPVTKKLEIDEDKAGIIRYAFQLCKNGYGASKISQSLNDMNYKTANGNPFTTRAVKDMLKTQTYKGYMVYNNYTKTKRKGKVKREINDTIIIENAHPPIIDPILFDEIQEIRGKRADRYAGGREKPNTKITPSILKDLVYCKICNKKMRISYEYDKGYHLIRKCVSDMAKDGVECSNSGFLASNIEIGVIEHLLNKKEQLETEILNLAHGNTNQIEEDQELLLSSLEKQILILDNEMKGLLRLELKYEMEDGNNPIQEEFIREEKQKNIDKRHRLEAKVKKLKVQMDQPSPQEEIVNRQQTINYIEELMDYDTSEKESAEKINQTLKRFIKKIHYERVIPDDIQKLGAKNPIRRDYPAEIEIEYFND